MIVKDPQTKIKKIKATDTGAKAPKVAVTKAHPTLVAATSSSTAVEAKKVAKSSKLLVARIRVKQIVGSAGKVKKQLLTVRGLGLRKINHEVELEDTPSVRGMINKVKHLVKIIT